MRVRSSVENKSENYASELIERRWLSNKSFEIILTKPKYFEYIPGQWIRLNHHAVERDYSLVSAPIDPHLALCIRNVAGGRLSPGLGNAPVGSRLNFNGPHGYFTFRPSTRPAVFVATGTIGTLCIHGTLGCDRIYFTSRSQVSRRSLLRIRT